MGNRGRIIGYKRGKGYHKDFLAKEQFSMLISKRSIAILICLAITFGAAVSAMAIETTLAGIRLGAPGSDVLRRYGNPTRITVGYVAMGGDQQGQPGAPGTAPGAQPPGNALGPLGALGGYYNTAGSLANDPNAPILPPMGGLGMPGMPPGMGGGMIPGQPDQGQQAPNTEQQITWSYDRPGGTTIEFIISDKGLIVQITAGGNGNFALAKTSKGVKFGTSYKDVVLKYGFPEGHTKIGKFVRASYADKDHVLFTFMKEKVVGITVALKLDD